jgi:hypothetical protein
MDQPCLPVTQSKDTRLRDPISGKYLTLFDPVLFESACQSIENGKSIRSTCDMLGIPFSNLYEWAEREQQTSERFARARRSLGREVFLRQQAHLEELERVDDWTTDPRMAQAKVSALKAAAEIARDIGKRLVPDELGDKLETLNRSEHLVYVVSFDPGSQGGEVVDVTPSVQPIGSSSVKQARQPDSQSVSKPKKKSATSQPSKPR